jgi:hypothetical protein
MMKDLDDFGRAMESEFGLISGWCMWDLHRVSVAAGSNWDVDKPETMEIIVTKDNAAYIYGLCKEIRSGYSVGIKRSQMQKVKEARMAAHKFLFEEANDPNTPIERKIYLVKLTGKDEY